jgi:hypothetical protein
LIFKSDKTHLSNFASTNKVWPANMIIGKLGSKISLMPSMQSGIMIAFLPIPIKNGNILQMQMDDQQQVHREVLHEVLRQVFQPLTWEHNPYAKSGHYNVRSVGRNYRSCKLVLAAWLADCPEYSDLHLLEQHVWYWCKYPKNKLGGYVAPDKQHPIEDHNLLKPQRCQHQGSQC